MAWLAKPATASRMIERVGTFWVSSGEVTRAFKIVGAPIRSWALTGRSAAGFLPRNRRIETAMIDKTYQPSAVEGRIYAQWEEAGAFHCGRPERANARPYCIVIPPPNVTGSLHMGHALNNTLQDVLARFERMRGRDVLWQV